MVMRIEWGDAGGLRAWGDVAGAGRLCSYSIEGTIMSTHEQVTEHKSFSEPDETREFSNGKAEILKIGQCEVGRFTFAGLALVERYPAAGADTELPGAALSVSRGRQAGDPDG